MKPQTMIYRLIDLKRRAVDVAEMAHVAAHHATVAAERALQENAGVRSIAELEQDVLVARTEEAMQREAMTEARIELRRYETWLKHTNELQRIEVERKTRKHA